jgi:fibronectin type 3 domain-containing protein
MRSIALISSALLLLALGCGTPGVPQPPSLQLPQPVDDLTGIRKGNRVVLTWTPPTRTTDKQNLRKPGFTHVCRATSQFPIVECGTPVASLGPDDAIVVPGKPPKKMFEDQLPAELQRSKSGEFATYALEIVNDRGRSAGASNEVRVPLAPALQPPEDLKARVQADGVALTWSVDTPEQLPDLRYSYRIYRQLEGGEGSVPVAEVPLNGTEAEFTDRSFEWERTYKYRVVGVTEVVHNNARVAELEGEDSPVLTVFARDTFPPAQSGGVQAVFSGPGQKPFIDLTWAPNLEADLAGYNVYRRAVDGQPVKINSEPVKAPSFRDEKVEAGREYFYSVSAVDLRGNESERSPEASERTAQ